jgi:hypothetical protein
MWKRSAGIVAVGLLLAAASGAAAAPDNQQTRNGAPPVTGTMYDGNNTQPPKRTLQGPLAPITEALESSAAFPADQAGGGTSAGANAGGNSGASRAGGGN